LNFITNLRWGNFKATRAISHSWPQQEKITRC